MGIDLSRPPEVFRDFLDAPREETASEEKERTYWVCIGNDIKPQLGWLRRENKRTWVVIFMSAEEAETHAISCCNHWAWNKMPASQITLSDCMRCARQENRLGVRLLKYDHETENWGVIEEWPVDVPLA